MDDEQGDMIQTSCDVKVDGDWVLHLVLRLALCCGPKTWRFNFGKDASLTARNTKSERGLGSGFHARKA